LDLGCTFSINPDAHSIAEVDLTRWGVAMARKGGISADRVLNSLDLAAFRRRLERASRSASSVRAPASKKEAPARWPGPQ
jgi:DNA polymerase (family 10)